jgi:hypothetical protein
MGRRYGEAVEVTLDAGQPAAFTWRGRHYPVTVIGTWRLATRWWWPAAAADRTYYRVQTADYQVFELYHDRATGAWVLDVCQD